MAGPQTRKKESKGTPVTGKPTAEERHRRKVDDAFDLVNKIEMETPPVFPGKQSGPQNPAGHALPVRSGLRVRFGIDALISDKDKRAAADREIEAGESVLFDFGLTVPYFWKIPVVGRTVMRFVKYLQKEDRPESVRDILKSLRQK